MINSKWIRVGCIAASFLMAATLLLGAHQIGRMNSVPHFFHKVEHFFYYGIMAILLAHGLGRRWFWIALLVVPLFGALDEWHQIYVPGRNSSAWDWATDVLGSSVAVYVYSRWAGRREPKGEWQDCPRDTGRRP